MERRKLFPIHSHLATFSSHLWPFFMPRHARCWPGTIKSKYHPNTIRVDCFRDPGSDEKESWKFSFSKPSMNSKPKRRRRNAERRERLCLVMTLEKEKKLQLCYLMAKSTNTSNATASIRIAQKNSFRSYR